MEKLEIKKVYVDTRFKTDESKSDTDFTIQLPKTFNVPDDVVCYIDDITLPVSWATISARNDTLYLSVTFEAITRFFAIVLDEKNHNAVSFTTELQTKLNEMMQFHFQIPKIEFTCTYSVVDNKLKINFQDLRTIRSTHMEVTLYSNRDVKAGRWNAEVRRNPNSINDNIGLQQTYSMRTISDVYDYPAYPFDCYLDLHGMRNLYLQSSALSNYDTFSNFGMDSIVKKIPIRAKNNEIIFCSANEGFDHLNVSKRQLSRIDFKLTDINGNTIDLRDNHWGFSLIFVRTN